MGLQPVRCALGEVSHRLGRRSSEPRLRHFEEALDRDGVCMLTSFFPVRVFSEILQAFERYRESPFVRELKDKDHSGVTWYQGPVTVRDAPGDSAATLIRYLADEPRMIHLASYVLRRRVRGPLLLGFQWLYLPENERDDRDIEGALHADRHYPCVKAVYYVNDNTVDNGAFVFCKGSHRLSWERLKYEYEYSARHQAWIRTGRYDPRFAPFDRGRPVPSAAEFAELGLHEAPIEAPANTLVISNNMGFHRRGQLLPGRSRKQVRILFYDYQAPLIGRVLRRIYKRRVYGVGSD
jgi:hypothetical protein